MVRKALIATALSLIFALSLPLAASAHVLRTDGALSAELHTEPYDHPVAGEKTVYHLYFETEPDGFNLGDYTGTIRVMQGNKILQTQKLTQTSPGTSQHSFTFPAAGSYTVSVVGSTTHAGEQASFKFSYPVEVKADPAPKTGVNPAVWVVGGVVLLGLIGAAIGMERSSKTKSKTS